MRIGPAGIAALAAVVASSLAGCAGVAGSATATGTAPAPSVTPSSTPTLVPPPSPSASPAAGPSPDAPTTAPPSVARPPEDPASVEGTSPEIRTFLVRDWQRIDATMDNTGSIAREDGRLTLADRADHVRDEGWRAVHEHPEAGLGRVGWPPDDAELAIRLDAATWAFVCAELRGWADVDRQLLARARPADRAVHRESLRWGEAMLAALESGSAAPRSDP
jgi:hypothetical protein